MNFLKKNMMVVIVTIVLGAVISLLGTLYAQQNKKIDVLDKDKIDRAELVQTIEKLEAIRDIEMRHAQEARTEQKEWNKEQQSRDETISKDVQALNIQILLLIQQLKKESTP